MILRIRSNRPWRGVAVLGVLLLSGCDRLSPLSGTYAGREQVRAYNATLAAGGMDPHVDSAPEVIVTVTSEGITDARVEVLVRSFARCRGEARRGRDRHPGWTRLTLDPSSCTYWSELDEPACPMRTRGPILIRGSQTDGVVVEFAHGMPAQPNAPVCAAAVQNGKDMQLSSGLAETDPQFLRGLLRPRTQ